MTVIWPSYAHSQHEFHDLLTQLYPTAADEDVWNAVAYMKTVSDADGTVNRTAFVHCVRVTSQRMGLPKPKVGPQSFLPTEVASVTASMVSVISSKSKSLSKLRMRRERDLVT